MAILNSKELWHERSRLVDEQRKFADAQDEDKALIIQGQIEQLDVTLDKVISEEDAMRRNPMPKASAKSFGEMILGDRDEFRPLEVGFKNEVTVVTVGAPTEIELELDPKQASPYDNFASTMRETAAIGSVSYKQRAAQTGNPATWAGVTEGSSAAKAKVLYAWKEAVANKETIAGYVPISKDTLADYDELLSIIEGDLLLDLNEVTDSKYFGGNNSTGIVGIKNTTGIQEFDTAMAGMYFDAIRKMRTKVMATSRRVPTHVCISPVIKEAIDLYKTENGLYQSLGTDNYWGMKVIEDPNCDGILVYDAFAAMRRSIHGTSVEVGYYNDQFIKNELSILAEHTKALQVRFPDAFCYASQTNLDKTA